MSIKTQTIMGRLLMFDEIIKGKAEMVRQVEDVMLVVEPVDTFRHKEYNCPDKMQEERKEHRRNTENQTQDFHPNSNKKAYFLLSLHFVIWLDDLSISIMILELLELSMYQSSDTCMEKNWSVNWMHYLFLVLVQIFTQLKWPQNLALTSTFMKTKLISGSKITGSWML
ncbi:hypothetical protein DAPPUDRAFT_119159 [Daphnia pulex]|uniref:Uncharacterized protein n=1 Tax=Daphnia pulex TaxID=6669 RepID=E9HXN1_DAPPU|nr:hypothetical protein DAPPUDRAFT_119159 [Daphnia pulex]|eukprot:EFX63501.1 hypothetical protein DAPPUDRAFT_119159 [Daphnia pulex]